MLYLCKEWLRGRVVGMRSIIRYLFALFLLLKTSLLQGQEKLLQLDLEDLAQIQTADTASTLIKTHKKLSPCMVTTITQEQIQDSGARTLDEVLEIYVPDIAYMYKVDGNQIGIGGIISDRNNKILLVVNGRMINVKGRDGGTITERFFPLLGDIKEVQVISGPGAVIYGPGAIAGVISITTFDSTSFDGFQSNAALGYGEEFSYIDLKYATTLSNDLGIFLYAGIDRYEGVDKEKVKNRFAFDYPSKNIQADKDFLYPTVSLNGYYNKKERKKFHFQMKKGELEFWSRFTQNSLAVPTFQSLYISKPLPPLYTTGTESDQWSSVINYKHYFSDISVAYSISYLRSELEKNLRFDTPNKKTIKEENLDLKALLTYHRSETAIYALGAEYVRNRINNYQNNNIPIFTTPKSWSSELGSLYGEMQHGITQKLMSILDLRIDKHTYTSTLYSGRAATIYTATPHDIFKLNYSHSIRHIDEVDLYQQVNQYHRRPDTESIDRVEFIYNNIPGPWNNTFKAAYNIEDVVSYDLTDRLSRFMGTVQFYTLEGVISYHTSKYELSLSHLYTGLIDFKLARSRTKVQNISANAYGYGNNFANWHSNITKFRFDYNFNKKLKFISSLRIFWGLDGAKEMADYNKENYSATDTLPHGQIIRYRLPYYDSSTEAFKADAYLNLSLRYNLNKQATLYLHGYDLLGLVDENLNKRNYFQTSSNYLIEEPSVSIAINYKFF